MGDLLQLIVSGTATGAIYALAALGFTLLWQAAGTINFAQGEFVMLPAFLMLFFMAVIGAPLWLAFLLTCVVAMLLLGVGFKYAIVNPLIRHGVIPLVIATLGLVARPEAAGEGGLQRRSASVSQPVPRRAVRRSAASTVSYADIGTLVLAGLIVIGLQTFLNRTVTGRAMQAVAQNTDAAQGARHRREPHGALHVPDQRRARRRRRAAGHADLSRQVRHGRFDRPEGVLRGDHRRLQPDARCAARRRADRRPREPRRLSTSRPPTRKVSR